MAKIIGNTIVTPMAVPDWTQNDATKADYIKNKPDVAGAIKGFATGSAVSLTDVSPIEHTMTIKAMSDKNKVSLLPYTVTDRLISGIPYILQDDGMIHLYGKCEEYGNYTLIKEMFLPTGEYTISAIADVDQAARILVIYGEDGTEFIVNGDVEKETFKIDTGTNVKIYVYVENAQPEEEFDFRIKPLLSRNDMGGVEVIVCDENHDNEATYYTNKNGYVFAKSMYPTTIIQTNEDARLEVEYNRDVNKALNEHSDTLRDQDNAIKQTNQIFSNALKGKATGEGMAIIDDISPTEHDIKIKLLSDVAIPLGDYRKFGAEIQTIPVTIKDGCILMEGKCTYEGYENTGKRSLLYSIPLTAGTYTLGCIGESDDVTCKLQVTKGDYSLPTAPLLMVEINNTKGNSFTLEQDDYIHISIVNTLTYGKDYYCYIRPLLAKGDTNAYEENLKIYGVTIGVSEEYINDEIGYLFKQYSTDESGCVYAKSLFPTTLVHASKDTRFEVTYNKDINKVFKEHTETLSEHAETIKAHTETINKQDNAIKQTNQLFANALKGKATGEAVSMTDVSPIEHTMSVKATIPNNIPLYPYTINEGYISNVPYEIKEDGTIHIIGRCIDYSAYSLIKEVPLTAGKYTMCAVCDGNDTDTDVSMLVAWGEDGVESPANTNQEFTLSEDTTIRIHIYIGAEPNKTYDFLIKPLLSKGAEIAPELSSVKVYKQGTNLINPEEFTKKSTNTTLVGDVFTTNFIDGRIFLNSGKISPFKAGTYTVTITPMKYSKPLYMGIYVYGVNDPNTVILQPKYIDAQVEPYTYTFTPRGDFIFALGGYKATASTNYEGLGAVSYTVQLVEGEEPASVEEYSIAPDGTVEGVTSIYPRTALYTDTAGVTLEVEYNRDVNKAYADQQARIERLETMLLNSITN